MKNKAIVTNLIDISYGAEICYGKFIDSGLVIRPSEKSNIKIWIPKEEIKRIILPDSRVIEGAEIDNIFKLLEDVNEKYGLGE